MEIGLLLLLFLEILLLLLMVLRGLHKLRVLISAVESFICHVSFIRIKTGAKWRIKKWSGFELVVNTFGQF
jgi:hypothetical protein